MQFSGTSWKITLDKNEDEMNVPINVNDGRWHHGCFAWSASGEWAMYSDGTQEATGQNYGVDLVLPKR